MGDPLRKPEPRTHEPSGPLSEPRDLKSRPAVEDEELVMFLERDQLVSDRLRPVPRVQLSTRARVGLWGLRIFVLVIGVMVVYTFFSQLGS